jgi:oxygen-dependent protoporphyrinogen oxidase
LSRVLVVGGGIAGLALAYDLGRRGRDLLLLEEQDRLGGLIFSRVEDGFLMDGGPDAFLRAKPDARALCQELGLGAELIPTNPERRRVYVLYGGRLHPLPEGFRLTVPTRVFPFLASSLFSFRGKLRMLLEPFVPSGSGEESIASFVTRRFGREALERVAEPLLAGIHLGDPEKLSMNWLFPNLVAIERKHGSLTRGLSAERAPREDAEESVFLSLAGGMRRLVERLAQEIRGEIRLGQRVVGIRRIPAGLECELASGEKLGASAIVLALPIRVTERLLREVAPKAAWELSGIETISSAVLFHAFPRANVSHPLDGYGFVVPYSEPNELLAATFVSTKFPDRAPDSHVLLRTFLGGRRDPRILDRTDAELEALSLRELERALGPLGAPAFSRVIRWKDRTPQVTVGHARRIEAFEGALREIPGLRVLGSGIHGVGIPDSIAAARALAQELGGSSA